MSRKVNLDALINREDFEIKSDDNQSSAIALSSTIRITDLEGSNFFFIVLRKPDFQRETNEWDSVKICELIESFLDGDLIPSIILWKSEANNIFVLDGAHRLSALAAWVNDDYGDGSISKEFYDGIIPDEQIKIAEKTRSLVRKRIGTYTDHRLALKSPNKFNEKIAKRARALGSLGVELQWVKGDASSAEKSFFRINQKASRIDSTELEILKSRRTANAIAARAIIRAGAGHKYWSSFPQEQQIEIENYAKDIYNMLFHPQMDMPIKSLDLPMGGTNYSCNSLSLVFESINIINEKCYVDDLTGDDTIEVLRKCQKAFRRINSICTSSLGLHPLVYFYSHRTGRYQISAFMAVVALILELEEKNLIRDFISVRENFEDIITEFNYFNDQTISKYGSGIKSYGHLKNLYLEILNSLIQGIDKQKTIDNLINSSPFSYLKIDLPDKKVNSKNFSTNVKNAVFIKEGLNSLLKCKICNGYIHKNSITYDHRQRKSEGGTGTIENGQLSHPYCNSVIKN